MPGIRLATLVRKLRRDAPDTCGRGDADLLARFAASRDESAFELLVWRHGAMVLATCRRALGHTEDAEDAFQAAFLVLARKAGSVRGSVPAWLHRVAVRIAGKVARKRRPTLALSLEPAARTSPDAVELGDLRGLLDAEIDRLSEPCRRAFVLCYLEGLSNADAARLIGCPVGTIESRLTAARKKLRARLARRNVELPAGALALVAAQSGLAKDVVAVVVRAGKVAAERGVNAAVGVVREPAAKLAQGVLVMTKLRTTAAVSLGVALLGLAAGAGWAGVASAPPPVVQPEVAAAAEPEVAPQPTPKDEKPAGAWPVARKLNGTSYTLAGVGPDGLSLVLADTYGARGYSLSDKAAVYRAFSTNPVSATAFSPDGKFAVTAEGVNGVKFRDAKKGAVIEGLWPSGDMPATQVGFSADGSKFVVVCTRTPSPSPFGGRPFGGKEMTGDERAKMIEAMQKASKAGLKGGSKAGPTYRVTVWDTATRKELRGTTDDATSGAAALTLAGHGRFVLKTEGLSARGDDGEERFEGRRYTITDPVTNKSIGKVDVKDAAAAFGRDPLSAGGDILALSDGNALRFVETATGKVRFQTPPFRRPVRSVAFSADGRFAAAGTGFSRPNPGRDLDGIAAPSEVVVWELATGKELARLVDQAQIRNHGALAFSPDGSFLASQSSVAEPGIRSESDITLWGNPPAEPKPEPKPVPKAVAPADVPDRFQALFTTLAADDTPDAKRVESLFLAALGRLPSDVEARTLVSQLAKRPDKAAALKDLLGTLVETAEFKAHAEALGRLAK